MQPLDDLLDRLKLARGGLGRTHCWVGDTPDVRKSALVRTLASKVGYDPAEGALQMINRRQAALGLSFLAANELGAVSPNRPREGLVAMLDRAFEDFDGQAQFYSNADWGEAWRTPSFTFRRLSEARVDGGVIGFDGRRAFVFWVEED